jgi:hypothetical protein
MAGVHYINDLYPIWLGLQYTNWLRIYTLHCLGYITLRIYTLHCLGYITLRIYTLHCLGYITLRIYTPIWLGYSILNLPLYEVGVINELYIFLFTNSMINYFKSRGSMNGSLFTFDASTLVSQAVFTSELRNAICYVGLDPN